MVMRVVIKRPGIAPEIAEIGDDLDSMQAVIAHGDYTMLEHVADGPDGLDLWANEEGKYASKGGVYCEPNLKIFDGQDFVMGTVFIAGSTDDGDTRSLTAQETASAIEWLKQHAVSITEAAIARAFAEQFR